LDLESASSQSGADKTASSSGSTPAHANSDFQVKLERYLNGATRSTEEVCMWIQQNTNGDINPSFIRALVTAVTESCIDGKPVFHLFSSHRFTIFVCRKESAEIVS
jgi:hypothetical protein